MLYPGLICGSSSQRAGTNGLSLSLKVFLLSRSALYLIVDQEVAKFKRSSNQSNHPHEDTLFIDTYD